MSDFQKVEGINIFKQIDGSWSAVIETQSDQYQVDNKNLRDLCLSLPEHVHEITEYKVDE